MFHVLKQDGVSVGDVYDRRGVERYQCDDH